MKKEYLINKFEKELVINNSYIKGIEDICKSIIINAIDKIILLNYEKIELELTPFKSAIFTIIINNSEKIYLDLYFEIVDNKECYFAYFKNKKSCDSGVGTITKIMYDIKKYL